MDRSAEFQQKNLAITNIYRHLNNQSSDSAQTYVLTDGLVVTGYYGLGAGAVTHDEAETSSGRC